MKKLKVFTAVFMVCLLAFGTVYTVFAAVFIEDWGYRFVKTEDDAAYEINQYIGEDAEVNIPNQYNGFKIVSVGEYAFISTSISKVTLGSNIVKIKNSAFINVTGLTDVVLNDGLTAIGNLAFAGCTGLTELMIPASVTEIADDAFLNCDGLVIYCYADSAAHQYAVEKNIPFELIEVEVPTEPSTEPRTYMLGDADGDQDISVLDVTVIQRVLNLIPVSYIDVQAADVNGDGLDIIDATIMQRFLAYMHVNYPIGEWMTA